MRVFDFCKPRWRSRDLSKRREYIDSLDPSKHGKILKKVVLWERNPDIRHLAIDKLSSEQCIEVFSGLSQNFQNRDLCALLISRVDVHDNQDWFLNIATTSTESKVVTAALEGIDIRRNYEHIFNICRNICDSLPLLDPIVYSAGSRFDSTYTTLHLAAEHGKNELIHPIVNQLKALHTKYDHEHGPGLTLAWESHTTDYGPIVWYVLRHDANGHNAMDLSIQANHGGCVAELCKIYEELELPIEPSQQERIDAMRSEWEAAQ